VLHSRPARPRLPILRRQHLASPGWARQAAARSPLAGRRRPRQLRSRLGLARRAALVAGGPRPLRRRVLCLPDAAMRCLSVLLASAGCVLTRYHISTVWLSVMVGVVVSRQRRWRMPAALARQASRWAEATSSALRGASCAPSGRAAGESILSGAARLNSKHVWSALPSALPPMHLRCGCCMC